ncbi:MAG: 30S ribosome-binding factor RbfA [Clostridia bacterium]|nr:30S ribosome-binding factor RbfA [Clostridia bacterium]MBR5713861.1 30S ribosome-binding factor RbfA [Clostridia bacterium]
MGFTRFDRINEEIKKALSDVIRDMKDPRISPLTTVMRAEATNDLKQCKVWISVYDRNDEARSETVAQLNRAEGFIAREMGRHIDLRHIPKFIFKLDDSIEYSVHISEILSGLDISRKESDPEDE